MKLPVVRLGASLETKNAELLKVGETCKMAIPNQTPKGEGVELDGQNLRDVFSYD